MTTRRHRWMWIALLSISMVGCASFTSLSPSSIPLFLGEPPEAADLAPYAIGPGDALSVKLYYSPDLNEDVSVRPDGRISLQLIGEVEAAGRSPEELSKEISGRYRRYVRRADAVVILRGYASQRVYVGGEVRVPKMVFVDGRTNLADAVFDAGGALDTAELSSVILLRRGPSGRETYRVDLDQSLEGAADLPILRPYDVVYVPKSFIAKVGTFVDLYINRIIPRNTSFTAIYDVGPEQTVRTKP